MTKYINKQTGANLDYDQICIDFENSLTWDGETNPEEFLMEAYEFEFEDWMLTHGIESIEVPDSVKPKKVRAKKKNQGNVCSVSLVGKPFPAVDPTEERAMYHILEMNPSTVECVIASYGSEDESRRFIETATCNTFPDKRMYYAVALLARVAEYRVELTGTK